MGEQRMITRARARVMAAAYSPDVDRRTALADARIALCAAKGIPLDRIDPAQGWDITDSAYAAVRASWRDKVTQHGWNEYYDRPGYEKAHALWVRLRPDLAEGDDWLDGLDLGAEDAS